MPTDAVSLAGLALLGASGDDRLLLINGDDLGLCPAANDATLAALAAGRVTSATLVVPAQHAEDAARAGAGLPIGVHLTLNSEWPGERWRPLTAAPSLCTPDGAFHPTTRDTCDRARTDEVRAELRAQVDQALRWGIDITHLDSHMYVLQERTDFFEAYLDLAADLRVPVRVSGSALQSDHPFRRQARERKVPCPDHLVRLHRMGSRADLMAALTDLPAGLTEFHLHPAVDGPDLRRLAADWPARVDDARLLEDPDFWAGVERAGARVVGYRDLRDAARSVMPTP